MSHVTRMNESNRKYNESCPTYEWKLLRCLPRSERDRGREREHKTEKERERERERAREKERERERKRKSEREIGRASCRERV